MLKLHKIYSQSAKHTKMTGSYTEDDEKLLYCMYENWTSIDPCRQTKKVSLLNWK
jgi:hypothetical protein